MPLESHEQCPFCGHNIILTKGSDSSFRCSACRCEFRHNFRKWIVGIPILLIVSASVAYSVNRWLSASGEVLAQYLGASLGFGVSFFVIARTPSYIITRPGTAPAEVPKK